jgi:staphylococcal nuclease domain-containing protein 1
MANWLKGVVKEVSSGDSVTIVGGAKTGVPPEKRLTLSSLIAPKLVRGAASRGIRGDS